MLILDGMVVVTDTTYQVLLTYQLENLMNIQRKMMLLERDHTYTSMQ